MGYLTLKEFLKPDHWLQRLVHSNKHVIFIDVCYLLPTKNFGPSQRLRRDGCSFQESFNRKSNCCFVINTPFPEQPVQRKDQHSTVR